MTQGNRVRFVFKILLILGATLAWGAAADAKTVRELLDEGYAELENATPVWFGDAHERFFAALEQARGAGDPGAEAAARLALGRLRLRAVDGTGALAYFELARDLYRSSGDPQGEAEAEYGIGEAYVALGMLEDAQDAMERALDLDRATGGKAVATRVDARSALARTYAAEGAYDEAIRQLELALQGLGEADAPRQLRKVALDLGDLYHRVGRDREALEIFARTEEALASDGVASVDAEAIRAYFRDLFEEGVKSMSETFRQIENAEDAEAQSAFQESLAKWYSLWTSDEPPPTLSRDPDFAARRQTVVRRLPFGAGGQQEKVITPRIRWRVVTSYRILEPLVRDCGDLYGRHPDQVTAVTARLEEEIPGLADHRKCASWQRSSAEMSPEEREAAAAEVSEDCSGRVLTVRSGPMSFWDLKPRWPPDCGEQPEDGFVPQLVGPIEERDPGKQSWQDRERSIREKYPELEHMSVDELIAKKEEEYGDVTLSFKGGFFKNLKKSFMDQLKKPAEILELKMYKMALEIREQGLLSDMQEKMTYIRLAGGFFYLDFVRRVREKHAATIEGMCRQAFESELRDSQSLALAELGPGYAEEARIAADAAWKAQEPLWNGMNHIGLRPESVDALRETLTPALVFEACDDQQGVGVNLRRIALWRGRVALEEGDLPLAAAFFHGAWGGAPFTTKKSDPELEIEALLGLGEAYERQEMPAIAAIYYQEALGLVESIQGTLREESTTMSFADVQAELYGRMVDLLIEMGEEELTFEYAARAQARAFLDLIGNQRLDLRGVPAELSDEWNALRAELAEVRGQETEIDPFSFDGTERRELKKRRDELEVRLDELVSRVRRRHPSAAAWVSVEPAPLENLSEVAVEAGTSVVVYFLSPKRVLAWIIEPGSSEQVIVEAERSEIEARITEARQRIASGETPAALLEELHGVLFAPLVPKIDHEKLIIVPYGPLHQLPFAALREPSTGRYLVEDYDLTLLPSASVVTYVQERRNPWQERLLAVGNPDGSLAQAEREAREVAELYGAEPLIGAAAEERLVRRAAGQLDVLHLAAHGRFSDERPLFGYLDLAAGAADDPQNDGRLEVVEVMNELDLAGSNLVVLSACNSSVGRRTRGDDVVSMPRAMLYAGTPAVVSTLWSIDDEASARLMTSFHRHLQGDSAGAAAALRAAQLELLQAEATAPPYFWAGFTLTGDHASRGAPPERDPGADNPWTYDPNAEVPPEPPPLVAERPAVLPWSAAATSNAPPAELAAEGAALLDERWAFGASLAYPELLRALTAARRAPDRAAEAAARVGLGRLRARAGDVAGALAHLELAEEIYYELGDVAGMATAQEGLGEAWAAWGALARSRRAYEDTLELRASLDLDQGDLAAETHEALAAVLELDGAYGSAQRHLDEAREIWRALGRPDRAVEAGVNAGELVASLSREDRSVEILEDVVRQMETAPPPDPAATAALLGELAALSQARASRMESWLAYAWFEDPFADWPEPPTVRDEAFTKRRRDNLRKLPDLLADLGEAPRAIAPIHREFALSTGIYRHLIRDCAHLHRGYSRELERLREALPGADAVRADWPAECGPGQKRFDPRHVWHTDVGVTPDEDDRRRGLAAWRSERRRLGAGDPEPAAADRAERDRGRLQERMETLAGHLRPLAWMMGTFDEDPSVLLSDKKIVYHLLGTTSAPLPERLRSGRRRYVAAIDRLCRQDLEVRAHNALWRSYTRLGPEYANEGERAREAAWQAAAPLWQTWARLGWVASGWEAVRDAGLPAPTLASCRGDARGFMDPHEVFLWRGHGSMAHGAPALAKVWYARASGGAGGWLKPRPGTRISALVGLAEVHAREGMPALAAIHYRKAIALAESVAEGLRRTELMTSAVDVRALYERLNEILTDLEEDTLVFSPDLRDGSCPDWLAGTAPLPEAVPEGLAAEREALCRDLVAVQNRETALRGNPFTIGGYQGPGNSPARLRSQRIWLENALHAVDADLRWPPEEPETGGDDDFSNAASGEPGWGEGGGYGVPMPGTDLIDNFKKGLLSKVTDKVKGFLKKRKRWLSRKLRGKKAKMKNLPSEEEVWGVTLYEKREFQGPNESFDEDDPSLKGNALGQDYARSVKVDPGCVATLYEDENYEGRSITLREDTAAFRDLRFDDDAVSSLKIECR